MGEWTILSNQIVLNPISKSQYFSIELLSHLFTYPEMWIGFMITLLIWLLSGFSVFDSFMRNLFITDFRSFDCKRVVCLVVIELCSWKILKKERKISKIYSCELAVCVSLCMFVINVEKVSISQNSCWSHRFFYFSQWRALQLARYQRLKYSIAFYNT